MSFSSFMLLKAVMTSWFLFSSMNLSSTIASRKAGSSSFMNWYLWNRYINTPANRSLYLPRYLQECVRLVLKGRRNMRGKTTRAEEKQRFLRSLRAFSQSGNRVNPLKRNSLERLRKSLGICSFIGRRSVIESLRTSHSLQTIRNKRSCVKMVYLENDWQFIKNFWIGQVSYTGRKRPRWEKGSSCSCHTTESKKSRLCHASRTLLTKNRNFEGRAEIRLSLFGSKFWKTYWSQTQK